MDKDKKKLQDGFPKQNITQLSSGLHKHTDKVKVTKSYTLIYYIH